MNKVIVVLLAAVLLILSACGESITEGVVTDKIYVPASSHVEFGSVEIGEETVTILKTVFDPEEWILLLKNCEQTGVEECVEVQIWVNSEVWNSANVGDRYP